MRTLSTIKRLHRVLERNITQIDPPLDYDRVIRALELLGLAVHQYEGDDDDWLYIGEFSYTPDSFIVGAYWHLIEWHSGQWSDSYRALCALGLVFKPGMTDGPEPESCEQDIYDMLNNLAETFYNRGK
jgi:hypothetical protein